MKEMKLKKKVKEEVKNKQQQKKGAMKKKKKQQQLTSECRHIFDSNFFTLEIIMMRRLSPSSSPFFGKPGRRGDRR